MSDESVDVVRGPIRTKWRCSECGNLIAQIELGRAYFAIGAGQIAAAFPISANCRRCGRLNERFQAEDIGGGELTWRKP